MFNRYYATLYFYLIRRTGDFIIHVRLLCGASERDLRGELFVSAGMMVTSTTSISAAIAVIGQIVS
jgi:hypothetical protein